MYTVFRLYVKCQVNERSGEFWLSYFLDWIGEGWLPKIVKSDF